MIIYMTKETRERYKIPAEPNPFTEMGKLISAVLKNDGSDRLLEWGAKLFYFDRRKCLQIVNFASKLTIVLVDVKVGDLNDVGNRIALYMLDMYADNRQMTELLKRFFADYPVSVFSALKDKSIIAALNHTQWDCLQDGYRLYDFIENNILQTKKLNKFLNFDWYFRQKSGKDFEYFQSGEKFEELLKERYNVI